ncbi:hypothetical protein V8E36_007320 [Tilletia maclaganii]
MSYTSRMAPVMAASIVGVVTGVYVFQPLLVQYRNDTQGTFRPEQKDLKVDSVAQSEKEPAQPAALSPAKPASTPLKSEAT